MNIYNFILMYPVPFIIVWLPLFINEVRLYKKAILTGSSFKNSIAMLTVALLSFILIQVMIYSSFIK